MIDPETKIIFIVLHSLSQITHQDEKRILKDKHFLHIIVMRYYKNYNIYYNQFSILKLNIWYRVMQGLMAMSVYIIFNVHSDCESNICKCISMYSYHLNQIRFHIYICNVLQEYAFHSSSVKTCLFTGKGYNCKTSLFYKDRLTGSSLKTK